MNKKYFYMGKSLLIRLLAAFLVCVSLVLVPANVKASEYVVLIEDDADILTDEEELMLMSVLQEVSGYGNVCIKTINVNGYKYAKTYADIYYDEKFGAHVDGVVLLIDMDNRELVLTSDGRIKKDITNSMADSIMDNVYLYATRGDYYKCCQSAFEQVLNLLEGKTISQPMKHICNLMLAALLSILINLGIVKNYTKKLRKAATDEISRLSNCGCELKYGEFVQFTPSEKELRDIKTNVAEQYSSSHYGRSGSYGGSRYSGSYSSSHSSSHSSSSHSSSRSHSSHSSHSSGSHRF